MSLFSLLTEMFRPAPEAAPELRPEEAELTACAPVSGRLIDLDEVPDVVISGRVAGEGVALVPDPGTHTVLSPCDGRLSTVLTSGCAFCVQELKSGHEIYVICGTGVARYHTRAFKALRNEGDEVRRGEPVLEVDLAALAGELETTLISVIALRAATRPIRISAARGEARAGESPILYVARAQETAPLSTPDTPAVRA